MPMPLSDPATDAVLGIRAYYVVGHCDLETALDRIRFGGMVVLDRDVAAEILRQPISVEQVKTYTGRDVTAKQIAKRLKEVTEWPRLSAPTGTSSSCTAPAPPAMACSR